MQVLCGCGVKAVVDLPNVERVPALTSAEIKPIHFLPSSVNPAMVSASR